MQRKPKSLLDRFGVDGNCSVKSTSKEERVASWVGRGKDDRVGSVGRRGSTWGPWECLKDVLFDREGRYSMYNRYHRVVIG